MGNNAFGSRKKHAAVGMGGIVAVINVVVVVPTSIEFGEWSMGIYKFGFILAT